MSGRNSYYQHGHEFEVPKLVESGGEYGGTTHKEPVSPCCEDDFWEVEE